MFFRKNNIKKIRNKMKKIREKYLLKEKQEKLNLVSILCHNIKTPLLAQITSLEFLLKNNSKNLDSIQKELLEENLSSNYILIDLIENIILLYDSEKNFYLENINLKDEIKFCFEKLKNQTKNKNLTINFDDIRNINLNTNKKLFQKIITNILNTTIALEKDNNINISLKENNNNICFLTENKNNFITKEKIQELKYNNATSKDFNEFGKRLNYITIEKIIKNNKWKMIIKENEKNSCLFGFEIKK